ncbi:ricin-type beta-trefoil lectin domain protein [Lysobacter sp. CA196]|uniref:ricin-type beta-trefoil lectin domain protein n=1 Tax=Lysobacter sp. CA196 TaxID=3455606 RepID=UPI003F8CF5B3
MKIVSVFKGWGLLCLLAALPLQVVAGNTPGSYVNYQFDPSVTGLDSVDFGITVETDPGARANVYWSNQFNLVGASGAAYTGMQRVGGQGGLFLFSVWNGTEAKVGSSGSYCITFQEDGTGKSCRMKFDWKPGHTYQFHVAHEGDRWFGVTVNDLTAATSFKLGSIRTASTQVSASGMVNWVEYFEWGSGDSNCFNQPYTKSEFLLPVGNGGARVASVSSTKVSPICSSRVDKIAAGSVHINGIGNSLRGVIKQTRDLCLDAHTYKNGDPATGYYCHGLDNQAWVHGADKTIRTQSNLCLDAYGYGTTPGTKVNVYQCHAGANQQWVQVHGELRGVQSGLCLTATVAGEQLTLQKCDRDWQVPMP